MCFEECTLGGNHLVGVLLEAGLGSDIWVESIECVSAHDLVGQ